MSFFLIKNYCISIVDNNLLHCVVIWCEVIGNRSNQIPIDMHTRTPPSLVDGIPGRFVVQTMWPKGWLLIFFFDQLWFFRLDFFTLETCVMAQRFNNLMQIRYPKFIAFENCLFMWMNINSVWSDQCKYSCEKANV